jgi:hypothetical protein
MNNFTTIPIHQNIYEIDDLRRKTNDGFFLVLTDIDKVPPHCSVLYRQYWSSLNYTECRVNIDAEVFLKTLFSKNKAAIFIEVDIHPELKSIENIFSKYTVIDFGGQITCISPVKDVLNTCGIAVFTGALLYEMIELLKDTNKIRKVYFFNSDQKIYILQHYSVNDLKTMKS